MKTLLNSSENAREQLKIRRERSLRMRARPGSRVKTAATLRLILQSAYLQAVFALLLSIQTTPYVQASFGEDFVLVGSADHSNRIILKSELFDSTSTGSDDQVSSDWRTLLDFKERIKHDPYGALNDWNLASKSSFCSWTGISCDNNKRVINITLLHHNLKGAISSSLGNLTFLSGLALEGNRFYGAVPANFGVLQKLEVLNLMHNKLGGNIPQTLSNCSNLEYLLLSRNKFKGTIPSDLGSLRNLFKLTLNANRLDGYIPPELGNLTSLYKLNLKANFLIGMIPPELGNLTNLRSLVIGVNNLTGIVPVEFSQLIHLERLDLGENNLTGPISEQMMDSWRSLTELYLCQNYLTGSIPRTIGNLTKLRDTTWAGNYLRGKIPEELTSLGNLKTLQFDHNQLSGHLPPELGNMTNMAGMIWGSNNLVGTLPRQLGRLTTLRLLDLSGNELSGTIPVEFGSLIGLRHLVLSSNNLNGTIPHSLASCRNLRTIRLDQNFLAGSLHEYPFGNLPELQILSLYNNGFIGGLPKSLANCSELTLLDLSRNNFSGSIPPNYFHFKPPHSKSIFHEHDNLRVLSLAYNNLTGRIPTRLWLLTRLQVLDLSHNFFSGELRNKNNSFRHIHGFRFSDDKELKHMKAMFQEYASTDYLMVLLRVKGQEFEYTYVLRTMTLIDLSSNQLHGCIPSRFCKLRHLQFLNLSHNQFHGKIPDSFDNQFLLEQLDVSHNQLENSFPHSVSLLRFLEVLKLSDNNLTGVIPAANNFDTKFPKESYKPGNPSLCGYPLQPCDSKPYGLQFRQDPHIVDLASDLSGRWSLVYLDAHVSLAAVAIGFILGFFSVSWLAAWNLPYRTNPQFDFGDHIQRRGIALSEKQQHRRDLSKWKKSTCDTSRNARALHELTLLNIKFIMKS